MHNILGIDKFINRNSTRKKLNIKNFKTGPKKIKRWKSRSMRKRKNR